MNARRRRRIVVKLNDLRERLELYKEQERRILEGGVKAYGIGSRNLTRYDLDLKNLRDTIAEIEDEIAELEDALDGIGPRPAVAVVPRDW